MEDHSEIEYIQDQQRSFFDYQLRTARSTIQWNWEKDMRKLNIAVSKLKNMKTELMLIQ